jgi:hypothetical protein
MRSAFGWIMRPDMILTRIKLWAAAIGAALVALLGLLAKFRSDRRKIERAENRAAAAETHIETRKEVENAIYRSRASGKPWHDRLQQHRDKR